MTDASALRRIEAQAAVAAENDPGLAPLRRASPLGYYNRSGERITLAEFALLCEHPSYRQVADTYLAEGRVRVSTVWLGLDHGFGIGDAPPLIFESMAFDTVDREAEWPPLPGEAESRGSFRYHADLGAYQVRYATEAEALEGHARIVAELEVAVRALGVEAIVEDPSEEDG